MIRIWGMSWSPWLRGAVVCTALLALALPAAAEPELGQGGWKFEVVYLKDGRSYTGLVDEETTTQIGFWWVKLPSGEPARRFHYTFDRRKVARIDRLGPRDRDILWARIQAIDPVAKARDEERRLEELNLQLQPVPWGKDNKDHGLSYTSLYFVLLSDAGRDSVSRAALRLEQIYAAYWDLLKPRRSSLKAFKPTRIVLLKSLAEYRALARSQGRPILNPAYYDPARNEIVCGSDLQRLDEAFAQVRQQEQEWTTQVAALKKRYKGRLPAVLRTQIVRDKKEIERVNKQNTKVFEQAARRLFLTLYHEAFHAYLDHFVYPARKVRVPCWLNEGLAQIFETPFIDAGVLRVGYVDDRRRLRARELANNGELVPVADLLRAGPEKFRVLHASDRQLADAYYVTSWALAFYLWVDQNVLNDRQKLDQYIRALNEGTAPGVAFRRLVGKPLPQFQKDFRDYMRRLKSDGSLVKKPRP